MVWPEVMRWFTVSVKIVDSGQKSMIVRKLANRSGKSRLNNLSIQNFVLWIQPTWPHRIWIWLSRCSCENGSRFMWSLIVLSFCDCDKNWQRLTKQIIFYYCCYYYFCSFLPLTLRWLIYSGCCLMWSLIMLSFG